MGKKDMGLYKGQKILFSSGPPKMIRFPFPRYANIYPPRTLFTFILPI
jgi:hypothetical protein